MKTESQLNQMRLNPNGVAVDLPTRLSVDSDVPKIIPLHTRDGARRLCDIVRHATEGQRATAYIVVIPEPAEKPAAKKPEIRDRIIAIERLAYMGWSAERIGALFGLSKPAITKIMREYGRPLSEIKPEGIIVDPPKDGGDQLILG
ncbi:hypothetical protein OLL83_001076 [Shewanella algae]|uniref:hypothetical protein n=1 Tax=Shewanella algae TaxID=38313 RepID=UPI00223267C6|nr:hypothetical protein [Shewanella algae]UZD59540.1 hypothetical protein OLL83_001076 [Shewanella algae]